ncbi:acyltransferase [bacterium]|nr:acyltransferase [bacterium]
MNLPLPLLRLAIPVAYWDRRIASWRARAQRLLLEHEHQRRLLLSPDAEVEPGVIWRLGETAEVDVGEGSRLRMGAELKVDGRLRIGKRVLIGAFSTLSVLDAIEIGDDCLLAERVSIRDHDHRFGTAGLSVAEQGYEVAPVRLGRNVWLGCNVTVLKGVSLGDSCVVGANAVVTASFPAGSVLAGVPARVIKRLPIEESHVSTD